MRHGRQNQPRAWARWLRLPYILQAALRRPKPITPEDLLPEDRRHLLNNEPGAAIPSWLRPADTRGGSLRRGADLDGTV